MSRIVKPVKVKRLAAEDVQVGELFTMNGVQYIKLADYDTAISCSRTIGILATTVLPLCEFDSNYSGNSKKSIEERAVCMFMAATIDAKNDGIIAYGMPDADDVWQFGHLIAQHVKDYWYVDNGIEDVLSSGDYLYVDEFCTICKGNEYDEKQDGVNRRLGVRALYSIDPDATVYVKAKR